MDCGQRELGRAGIVCNRSRRSVRAQRPRQLAKEQGRAEGLGLTAGTKALGWEGGRGRMERLRVRKLERWKNFCYPTKEEEARGEEGVVNANAA